MHNTKVTDRDIKVLSALGEYSVLDFALIYATILTGISAERCRQILARLTGAKLIRAIRLQVWYAVKSADNRYRGGRVPTLFVLTELGSEKVYQWTGSWPRRVYRTEPTPATFFHRLHVARVRMAFDTAVTQTGLEPANWIVEEDMRPDVAKDAPPNRRRWLYHEFATAQGTITCQPDAAVRVGIPHPSGGTTQIVGFLEVDLSREGHAQLKKKLPGYTALLAHPRLPYWPDLEASALRVFWITLTERRLRELAQAVKDSPIAERFRFTTIPQCTEKLLTDPVWQDLHGRKLSFLKASA